MKRQLARSRDSFEKDDEVWAIFDRDEHAHFAEPIRRCEEVGVHVARSNPCFEVWLIFHETDFHRPDDRHQVQAYLRQLRPEYDPAAGKLVDFDDLVNRVETAEQRAQQGLARRDEEGSPFGRPSTTVGRLAQSIRIYQG